MSSHYHPKRDAGLKAHHYAMALDEIGHALGVSRERVRQLENRALRKARTILHKHGYNFEDLLDHSTEEGRA